MVTVLCLCYNHEAFLLEALESVRTQTYPEVEIIVVDDASTDKSPELLRKYAAAHPEIRLILHEQNLGNCRAFNQALALAKGDFIVDFATDDVLQPTRLAEQVAAFSQLGPDYGVIFTDAELIDEAGQHLGYFYKRKEAGQLQPAVAEGDVFAAVLERYFISSPTLMMRREVYDRLGGYDESLAYEDFDLIVRAARDFKFSFLDKPLTRRRLHARQLSKVCYQPGDKQLLSTIKVCWKIRPQLRSEREKQAWIRRVEWEIKQAFLTRNHPETEALFQLLQELKPMPWHLNLIRQLNRQQVNLSFIRRIYHRLIY